MKSLHCTKNKVFQFSADLVTFTGEIRNEKLHFLSGVKSGMTGLWLGETKIIKYKGWGEQACWRNIP